MNFFSHRTNIFFPLTLSMPLQDILFGMSTLGEKWEAVLPDFKVWMEPTVLPDAELVHTIKTMEKGSLLIRKDNILACHPQEDQIRILQEGLTAEKFHLFKTIPYHGKIKQIESLQYLIENNKSQILHEWNQKTAADTIKTTPEYSRTFIHPKARVSSCIIDDSEGPVFIDRGVTVMAGARIKGPIVFLEGALVKMNSELYPGSTFGRHTTLNGEIKNVIIHDFSAKGHEGYLGDSILGRWNNLGAGTTVSNLKHTFSPILLENWNSGKMENIGSLKRGLITGDFVRLGILSKINNGTTIGSFTSIATEALIQGRISELTWWAGNERINYIKEKARLHALRQMNMKGYAWDDQWEKVLSQLNSKDF